MSRQRPEERGRRAAAEAIALMRPVMVVQAHVRVEAELTLPSPWARRMTCNRSRCTFCSSVIGRSSQSGSPATGWFTLGTIGLMTIVLSSQKCQHYRDRLEAIIRRACTSNACTSNPDDFVESRVVAISTKPALGGDRRQ